MSSPHAPAKCDTDVNGTGVGGTGKEPMRCIINTEHSAPSVDKLGGQGTVTERGLEQNGTCKYEVSVEANTCPVVHFLQNVTGMGDMNDSGLSSYVTTDVFFSEFFFLLLFEEMFFKGTCDMLFVHVAIVERLS